MITEDYVSFETAKLLKEKGFAETSNTIGTYNNKGEFFLYGHEKGYNHNRLSTWYSAPILQMVMKWLREVYGLFIRITEDITGNIFEWSVYQKNYGCKASTYVEDSYEKACEVAIKYCLENLI